MPFKTLPSVDQHDRYPSILHYTRFDFLQMYKDGRLKLLAAFSGLRVYALSERNRIITAIVCFVFLKVCILFFGGVHFYYVHTPFPLGDWFLEVSFVGGEERGGGVWRTFSSSLRFSLRFLRRRAISARRMACSSAVRCFFFWASVEGFVSWGSSCSWGWCVR